MRPRTSKLWTIPKETYIELLNKYDTFSNILRATNTIPHGGNVHTLKKVLTYYELDYSKISSGLNNRKGTTHAHVVLADDELFTENNVHSRSAVKKRILKNNLIPYKCEQCGQGPLWNGKKLVLVLDHINGIYNDNRLENLRFLCPNCNAQQETFCGKHLKFKPKQITNMQKEYLKELYLKEQLERVERIKAYDVDFSKYGWINEIAKLENCSHTSIRRFMKKYMNDFYNTCYHRKNQY